VRLTFEYDDTGQLRLVRRTTRPKPAPPGHDLDRDPRPDRIWIEVRDRDERRLYRRVLRDPLQQTAEDFHRDGRITRVPKAAGRGVFTVVVPDEKKATVVVIVAGPDARIAQPAFRDRVGGQPRELARVGWRR
jgi:hypothetical protein